VPFDSLGSVNQCVLRFSGVNYQFFFVTQSETSKLSDHAKDSYMQFLSDLFLKLDHTEMHLFLVTPKESCLCVHVDMVCLVFFFRHHTKILLFRQNLGLIWRKKRVIGGGGGKGSRVRWGGQRQFRQSCKCNRKAP
jgi:hypothetical protein